MDRLRSRSSIATRSVDPTRRAAISLAVGCLLLGAWVGAAHALLDYDAERSPLGLELHARVAEVMRHYYNFEFDEALVKAEAIRDRQPDHPVGHFLIAETLWWQIINNPEPPHLFAAFDAASRQAIDLSEKRLERDDRDDLALFFLGGAYGRQAILAGLDSRHFEAVQSSLTGRKYIKRLNKHHKEVDDAYFGLGLYDYYAAELPWFARLIGKLFFGLAGDKERGVEELERAAEHGLFTQMEARIFLAIIYLDQENRYEEALAILQQINQEFPENLDYYGMLAFAYRTQHDNLNAIRMLQTLVEKGTDNPAFGHRSRSMCLYFLGSTYKVAGLFEPATAALDRAIGEAEDGEVDWLLGSAYLERGRTYDLRGQREAALADYRHVLELKEHRGSHEKARALLETPHQAPEEETAHYLTVEQAGDLQLPDSRGDGTGSEILDGSPRRGDAGMVLDASDVGGPDTAGRPD